MAKRGRPRGYKLSEESKRKIADSKKGVKLNEKTKKKISSTLKTYFTTHESGHTKPDGSRKITNGYVFVKFNSEWVSEHRHIVETLIGRKLDSDEIVHHKDFNKINNRLYNLQLVTLAQHKIIHNKKGWLIIDKDDVVKIIFNLAEFCLKNNLCYGCMRAVADGKTKKGLHKGFSCAKFNG